MLFPIVIVALVATAAAHPTQHTHSFTKRTAYPNGIATFNNYAAQGNTNCGPSSGQSGTYGAAASDISPEISGGACSGHILMNQCSGQSPPANYAAPGCPKTNCGRCYKVTNNGGIGGSIGGVGKSIIVQIIDACPASSAYNFCKTDMPLNQRCGDSGTNQLDIDVGAYMALTGQAYGGGPNLDILIEDSECSGTTSSDPSSASPAASAQSSSASDLASGDPGQHSAAGDKLAEQQVGAASFNSLELESSDGSADSGASSSLSFSSTSSTVTPPPPQATTSATPLPSSLSSALAGSSGLAGGAEGQGEQEGTGTSKEEEDECDEL